MVPKLSLSLRLVLSACLLLSACSAPPDQEAEMSSETRSTASVSHELFGTLPDGSDVSLYTLRNASGIEVRLIDYGGIVLSIMAPDRSGELADIALGYDDLDGYLAETPYFGALIGRYGNRIAKGRFSLDGVDYELVANNDPNHLHGGDVGFDKVLWSAEMVDSGAGVGVTLTYESPDGEEGYPGTLSVVVEYLLNDDSELVIDYRATTDKPTPVNLTHHTYFNLAGGGDILGHELMIHADRFTPVDETLIPTGELAPVAGTPFDFTTPTAIGARISNEDEQLAFGGGYDHNFVLNRPDDGASISPDGTLPAMVLAARVVEPLSGRVLEVETTEPGLQFYSGNFLDGSIQGKSGQVYEHRSGFCLETQHFPDAPNQPEFPPTILRPGEQYHSKTIYRFTVDR
jgi:aldose 1-epimerase